MKKVLPVVIALLVLTRMNCVAQCPSNWHQLDVSASYGVLNTDQVATQFSAGETSGDGTKVQTYNSGAAFVTLRYYVFNRLAIAFAGGMMTEKGQYPDRTNPSFITSTYKQSFTTVAMEFSYVYSFQKYVETYTLLGVGPAFINTQTTTYTAPNSTGQTTTTSQDKLRAQYTPIGVRFGGKFGGFVELGYGYKGVLNGGLSYKFGRACWWKH